MTLWTRIGTALFGMFLLLVGAGAAERPLSLLLLPPVHGAGHPQLAISWKGGQTGQLELSVVDADGRPRRLQSRALEPGMHLQGVELGASDQTLVAILRDADGRELARAQSPARSGVAPDRGATAVDRSSPAPVTKTTRGSVVDWKATFVGNDGPNGTVRASVIHDDGTGPALVIGGDFTTAGGLVVNGVARWNGTSWSPLGSNGGNGVSGRVSALAVSGTDLYVGGAFDRVNLGAPVNANNVARWNGSAWSALGFGGGNGVFGDVRALAVSGSDLYVGGAFTQANVGGSAVAASNIARWTGNSWAVLGSGAGNGVNSVVEALAVAGADLYAGGTFTAANNGGTSVPANRIARWNGGAWSALGSGLGNGVGGFAPNVRAIAVSGSDVYVGGSFSEANSGGATVVANNIARWNGALWSSVGSGAGNGLDRTVLSLVAADGVLYAAGSFGQANVGGSSVPVNRVARWNGSVWSAVGGGGGNGVNLGPAGLFEVWTLAASGTDLYIGGFFNQANAGGTPVVANRVARWNGSAWSGLGGGMVGGVDAVAVYGADLIVAGSFRNAGGVATNHIARWNGTQWAPLGSGGGNGLDSTVFALLVVGTDLYVGGNFLQANVGGPIVAVNRIARWDGSTWSAIGSGTGSGFNGDVRALAKLGTDLYAGGLFSQANVGGTVVNVNNIARWNGTSWSKVGTSGGNGASGGNGVNQLVYALTVSGTDLYVGGVFTSANLGDTPVVTNHVARWNGTAWFAVGNGVNAPVRAIAVSGARVYVGGEFDQANNADGAVVPASRIAFWDGSTWSALGEGMNDRVLALHAEGNQVYAGGNFTSPGRHIARWDGAAWNPVGSNQGSNDWVTAFARYDNDLIAGGVFTTAGGLPSAGVAAYGDADLTSTEVVSTDPAPSRPGEPVRIRARVTGNTAPIFGHVTITGTPGGSCSDLTLTPVDATSSEAECTIRWSTADTRTVQAYYTGGGDWLPSSSAVLKVDKATEDRWPMFVDVETWLNRSVRAATVWDDGSGPALVVAGDFSHAGGTALNQVAKWNGTRWVPLGAGTDGFIYALTVHNGQLIAAGDFSNAGGVAASRIARWNGSIWAPLGSGMNNLVFALGVYGGELIAGGSFTNAGGVPANRIARWNGSAWSALGTGILSGDVRALSVYQNDLIVGGAFASAGGVAANSIARWNGTDWSALGTGANGDVRALTVYDGQLIAGGFFDNAGGVANTSRIAGWNGTAWSALGTGMNDLVLSLGTFGNELIVGGSFSTAGGTPANRIARWNGSSWSTLGSGMDSDVLALTVHDGHLLAGGDFTSAGGIAANRMARWNGSSWASLGVGLNGVVNALTLYNGELVMAGSFTSAGGTVVNRIARWNGSSWLPLGTGTSAPVLALTVYDGALIAGGEFTNAGGVAVNRIARWDGSSWSALGFGLNGQANALTVYNGELIAGGTFTTAGVAAASRIARWNGSAWSALGSGTDGEVHALRLHDGSLIAGGGFTVAGGTPASRIARWNGIDWSALGAGTNQRVRALTAYNGELVAGGDFTSAGGVAANRIARWNGSSWTALGTGMDGQVFALTVYGGNLIAAGTFGNAGGTPANRIARWNGLGWSTLGAGMDDRVLALAVGNGGLYAGGWFNRAYGRGGPYIAAWGPSVPTTTVVQSSSPNPSQAGRPVTLTARVSGRGAPNPGTVTFIGAPSGSCSDLTMTVIDANTSEASCTVTFNVPGVQAITARYDGAALPGDFGQLPSSSTAVYTQTVLPLEPSTTVIVNATPDPSLPGEAVAVAVNVSGLQTQPADGVVTVTASTGESCTDTTLTAGTGTTVGFNCAIVFNTVGTRTLTASFAASTTHAPSSSAAEPHRVNETTSTVITSDLPDPSLVGQAVTIEVAVTGTHTRPASGQVVITASTGESCVDPTASQDLGTTSRFSCAIVFNTIGVRTLTAAFDGLPTHRPSTSIPEPHTVIQNTTSTILSALPDPSLVGQPVGIEVAVTGTAARPDVGQVVVTASTGETCTDTTASPGNVTTSLFFCPITFQTPGARTLTATYSGALLHLPSSSAAEPHTVNAAATSLVLTGPASARINTAATYTATLTVTAPGAGTPVGTVTVTSDTQSCTITLPTPTPSCALSFPTPGRRNISAQFVPANANHLGSSSATLQTLFFANADLAVSKNTGVAVYLPNDLLVYTVQVENRGPDFAAGFRILDPVPQGLGNVSWTCTAQGGAICPGVPGVGGIDVTPQTMPAGSRLIFVYRGNVQGSPPQIVNVASVLLPSDGMLVDSNLTNNTATSRVVLDVSFRDGFEAPLVNGPAGALRIPGNALRSVLDTVARPVLVLEDLQGPATRVYVRVIGGEVEYALASRDASGLLRLADWQRPDHEPILRWVATEDGAGWRVVSVTLD